ncbi:hypothetical protein [Caproiciproducens galactitolivorans]|uniref:Uncharacterized protein n=1 Tax=Caproiciproducens galactitolivorans TaxID=642589 RepID=A0ABT4BQE9_9FIRM|nr:hypothetical protein [Caproiciproducens galactitolivorans]MCY1713132.1 hypothetical protein [Caproiciproducens galactitolivorans]
MTEKSIGLLYSPLLGSTPAVKRSGMLPIEEARMALGYAGFLLLIFAQMAIGPLLKTNLHIFVIPAFLLEGGVFYHAEKWSCKMETPVPFHRTSLKHS